MIMCQLTYKHLISKSRCNQINRVLCLLSSDLEVKCHSNITTKMTSLTHQGIMAKTIRLLSTMEIHSQDNTLIIKYMPRNLIKDNHNSRKIQMCGTRLHLKTTKGRTHSLTNGLQRRNSTCKNL